MSAKILVLDIETSPNIGMHWGLWQQNISINQLIESSTILCWAAKWVGDRKVHFASILESSPKEMIKKIHKLVDEADAIITYNGKRFDMPTLNREFLLHKLPPPSPYKDIDLLQTARSKFRFVSNKLDYVAGELGVGQKTSHEGMPLWSNCMAKDKKSWKLMKKYNINDVKLTEEVYLKLQGWLVTPFNHNTHSHGHVCPSCGGTHLQKRGFSIVGANSYQRFQCIDCGKWSKSNKASKELKKDSFIKAI
jgi:DNA polymerase elongation subunit (family B)|tara:strand:+ start:180 stop:929 length:750 start_codon:yes stop_codon:yes gene_type:complete